jgi:hypothetical protein
VSIIISYSVLLICCTILSANNRGPNQLILRRLGVKEFSFWGCNFLFVLLPTVVSGLIMGFTWHYTGVLPFSSITLGFCMLEQIMICILIASSAGTVVSACLFAFFLLIMPVMIHCGAFSGQTLFDPTLVPQWGTWLSLACLPVFNVVGLIDSMTSTLSPTEITVMLNQYEWEMATDLTPIDYLFTDYNNYTSIPRVCMNPHSKNGEWSDLLGKCTYYQPQYGYIVLLALLQSIVFPVLAVWFSYTVSSKGFRGLPSFFFFHRSFW